MFNTMNDIKRANKRLGEYWFDADTMRFFYSRVSERIYRNAYGAYFVSSEKHFEHGQRYYTVRYATPQGSVFTVGEFMQYETPYRAHKAAKAYEDILVKRPRR